MSKQTKLQQPTDEQIKNEVLEKFQWDLSQSDDKDECVQDYCNEYPEYYLDFYELTFQ